MIRRVTLLVGGLAAAAVLSSCSTFDTSAAARVNGDTIDDSVVETLLAGDGTSDSTAGSALDATQARIALSELIQAAVANQVADRYNIDLSAARAADQEQTKLNLTGERLTKWKALSQDERNLISDFQVAVDALRSAQADPPADLERRYRDPESTGFFCIRYISFETESAAAEASAKLRGGADFATLADAVTGQQTGGVASGPDNSACVGLDQFRPPNIPEPITAALFAAEPGVATDPIHVVGAQGQAWFILLHRPWSEISTDLTNKVAEAPVFAEFLAEIARTKASVSSRYGVWDALSGSVVQHS